MDMHTSLFRQTISFSVLTGVKQANPYVKVWIITRTQSLATSTMELERYTPATWLKILWQYTLKATTEVKEALTQRFKRFSDSIISVIEEQLDLIIPFLSWFLVSRGSQATVAASSCKAIHFKENSAKDGLYWLNSNGTEPPFLTFCKMKNGGGKRIFWTWILKCKWFKPMSNIPWWNTDGWVKSAEIREFQREISFRTSLTQKTEFSKLNQ